MRSSIAGGRRRSIRMRGYDYTTHAAYFITLCTHKRASLFGTILDNVVQLSPVGKLVQNLWIATPETRPGVTLDAFITMPDHFHAIVILPGARRAGIESSAFVRRPRSLGSLVAGYKSACTSVNALLGTTGFKVWQRNYYERVIRDEGSLQQMRRYLAANPLRSILARTSVEMNQGFPALRE
jgi:putative transposase